MAFLETAKDVYDLAKKGMTIELQEKIMELREQALALQEDNHRLRARVAELERKLTVDSAMEFKKPFYFRSSDEHPFCPVCWEKDKVSIHLKGPSGDAEWYTCPVCKWGHACKPERVGPIAVAFSHRRDRRGRDEY